MIELAKHIEILLLENDCVVVPGLGGFISHPRSATIHEKNNEFCPPSRSIGFNSQLIMNDGLLAQSYMQAYNTDFPDATRKIEKTVESLRKELYRQGHVSLPNIGTLYYNINGVYEFEPYENMAYTPSLYGLRSFKLQPLAQETAKPEAVQTFNIPVPASKQMRMRPWLQNVVAVAAAILLFFILSVPVENTYIDHAEYASLGSSGMFEAIRRQSVITTNPVTAKEMPSTPKTDRMKKAPVSEKKKEPKADKIGNNINTLKPVAVKTEKVATVSPQQKKVTPVPQKKQKKFCIIVASFPTKSDAQVHTETLKKEGYAQTEVLDSEGRFRVSLQCYDTKTAAYNKIQELKNNNLFKDAWVFVSK